MKSTPSQESRRQTLIMIFLIIGTVWLARFWHSSDFGFYDDDYWRVTSSMHQPAEVVFKEVARLFVNYGQTQGRPFHDGLIRVLSFAGAEIGGLRGVHFLAFVCVAFNAVLFYLLLRRISANIPFVWFGALAFALYPADTTQAFLTHSFGIQPSLGFLLLAAHLYLSGWRIASYGVATLSLFCYETVFLVATAIPLLEFRWDKQFRRRMLRHVSIVLAIFASTALLRLLALPFTHN